MLDEPVECAIVRPDASVKIRGWAYSEGTPLTLHVVVGEQEVAVASCEIYRGDVVHHLAVYKAVGHAGLGHVGFDVELPVTVLLGQEWN